MASIGKSTSAVTAVLRFGLRPSKHYYRAKGKKITAKPSFLAGRGKKKMKEKGNNNRQMNEEGTVHHLPPAWCSSICRNSMNEICVENCAIKRDCSAFDLRPNLKLADMPRFPRNEELVKPAEKFYAVTIYLSKIVDHLQGNDDGQKLLDIRRSPRAVIFDRVKAIAEVTAGLHSSQVDPAGSGVNIKPSQPPENITSREKE